ncbi:DUF222 domain-containing protein, partial [Microbispora sp. NPDC049125]|uniref:DUF222 domain-containing protein n=1 Tax=Microbispora sp. NPDC049125 TaxID=3154929 RepID=UPI003465D18E
VLKAAYRQSCHDRAWFLQVMLEVGLREQFSAGTVRRLAVSEEFAPDEARAALVWSRRRADSTFDLAWNVHRRLPVLGEAMLAGTLDEPRAAAFIRWTTGLTDEQAALVCDHLVDQAGRWTVGELIEHIQRLVLAIDPGWAEKRYTEAVKRRRVVGARNDDGTASVSGLDLPVDRAAAGCERIDELARSCKRAGDRRPIDHIRADLFLGSLDGTFEGLTDEQIITHIRTHPFLDTPPNTSTDPDPGTDPDPDAGPKGPDTPSGGPSGGTPTNPPDPTGGVPVNPSDGAPAGPPEGSAGGTPAGSPTDTPSDTPVGPPTSSPSDTPADFPSGPPSDISAGPILDSSPGGVPRPEASAAPEKRQKATSDAEPGDAPIATTARGWAVPELRVELATLLGLDEHPAHAPGWGMIHAPLARQMVTRMMAGEWRYAICTDNGHLLHAGITLHRPCPPAERPLRDTRRGGIVELQITHTLLQRLAHQPAVTGDWTALVADLTRQIRTAPISIPHTTGTVDIETGDSGTSRSWPGAANSETTDPFASDGKDRRQAGAALRRYVQIRGRACSWPGCRTPATRTDQDHVIERVADGPTSHNNLELVCRHDHRAKHQGGWQVTMPHPHLIIWTSPLGHTYPTHPPKIITPLPELRPGYHQRLEVGTAHDEPSGTESSSADLPTMPAASVPGPSDPGSDTPASCGKKDSQAAEPDTGHDTLLGLIPDRDIPPF